MSERSRDHRGYGVPSSEAVAVAPLPLHTRPTPPPPPAPAAPSARRPASRAFVTRSTTRSFTSRRPKTGLPRKAVGIARVGGGRVRLVGRMALPALSDDADSVHFELETAPRELRRVHLLGAAAVAHARTIPRGARVMVDGRVVGAKQLLLAYAIHQVA
jgi:hypothetical protein